MITIRHRGVLTAAIAVLLAAPAAAAESFDWNYIEGRYHDADVDVPGGGDDQSGNGLGLAASMAVAPNILLQAGTRNLEVDLPGGGETTFDRYWIGPGLYGEFELAGLRVGPWARIAYERQALAGNVAEGWQGALGVRLGLADRLELALSGAYADLEPSRTAGPDRESKRLRADLIYAVSPRLSLLAGYARDKIDDNAPPAGDDEVNEFHVGARWYFDPTPGGAFAAQGEPVFSGEANYNYLQAAYQLGDEVDLGGGDIKVFDGTVLAAAGRVSERFVIMGELSALNAAGSGEAQVDFQSLGPALRYGDRITGGTWLDVYAGISYERAGLAGDTYNGGAANLGARWLVGNLELAPRISLVKLNGRDNSLTGSGGSADLEGQRYRLEVLYSVSESVALLANYERIELDLEPHGAGSTAIDGNSYGLGLRFYYAGRG